MEVQMHSQENLQEAFLNSVRRESIGVVVNLVDGNQIRGMVKSFDNFTILIECDGKRQLVYKHGITSILPSKDPTSLLPNLNPSSRSAPSGS